MIRRARCNDLAGEEKNCGKIYDGVSMHKPMCVKSKLKTWHKKISHINGETWLRLLDEEGWIDLI